MLDLCDLPRSTFQGWTRAGLFERDPGGAYGEGAVLELVLIACLRHYFSVDELSIRWPRLRQEGRVLAFVSRARELHEGNRYDVVIEPKHGGISLAGDDAELVKAVRHPGAPRPVVVVDLAPKMLLARDSFRASAPTGRRPSERKVGRPIRRGADVRNIGDR
jgi:hypothetical protein